MIGLGRRMPLMTLLLLQQLTSIASVQSSGTTFFLWGNPDIVSLLSPSTLTFFTPHTSAFQPSRPSVLVQPYASSLNTAFTSPFSVLNHGTSSRQTVSTGSALPFSASPSPPSDTSHVTEPVSPKLWSTFMTKAAQSVLSTPPHTTSTPYYSSASTSRSLLLSPYTTSESPTSSAPIVSTSPVTPLHTIAPASLYTTAPLHSSPSDPLLALLSSLSSTPLDRQTLHSLSSPLSSSSSFSSSSTTPPPSTPVPNPPSAISPGLVSSPLSFDPPRSPDPESGVFIPPGKDSPPTRRPDEVISLPEVESTLRGDSSSRHTGFFNGDNNRNPSSSDGSPEFRVPNIPDKVPSSIPKFQVPKLSDKDLSSNPKFQDPKLSDTISVNSFVTEINSLNDNAWSGSLGNFASSGLTGDVIPLHTGNVLSDKMTSFLTEASPTTSNILRPEFSSSTSSPVISSPTIGTPSNLSNLSKVPEEILPDLQKSKGSSFTSSDYSLYVNQLTSRPISTRFRETPPIHYPPVPITPFEHPRTIPSGRFPNTGSPGHSGFSFSSPSTRGSVPLFNRTSGGFFDENSFRGRPDERTSRFFGSPGPWGPATGPMRWPPTLSLFRRARGLSLQNMESLESVPTHFLPVRKMSFYLTETSPSQTGTWLRLSGGRGHHEGRVEILAEGAWGTICDQDFDFYDAQVVCRMLGYSGTAWAHRGTVFGPGAGPTWINGLDCRGNETTLQDCVIFGGVGRPMCSHERDAGVTCFHTKVETVDQDLALLLPKESCGVPTDGSRVFLSSLGKVVGGRDLRRLEMPWLVSIVSIQGTTYKHQCGAALISEDLILTAAHCFRKYGHLNLLARVGDYWLNRNDQGQQDFEMEKIFVNPKFDAVIKSNNDIALIKIKRKFGRGVKMGPSVQPVCIPPEGTDYRNPEECHAVGWGRVREDQAGTSDIPKVARAKLYELDECTGEDQYTLSDVTSSNVCAGYLKGGEGVCRGDSGGPLTCRGVDGRYYLMGILSRVHGCGLANRPALFTRVTKYLRWIRDTMS